MKSRTSQKPMSAAKRRLPVQELFPQPGVYRPNTFSKPKNRRSSPIILGLFFFITFLAGFAGIGYLRRPQLQPPFVLVELRAIESTGHPVTAARVTINTKPMGVTDSFGEWRRYIRLSPGDRVDVSLIKAGNPIAQGGKILRVPINRVADRDYQVKATIEMISPSAQKSIPMAQVESKKKLGTQVSKAAIDYTDPDLPDKDLLGNSPEVSRSVQPDQVKQSNIPANDTNDSSMGIFFDDALAAISLQVVPFRGVPANLLEKHQAEILADRVIPMLATDLKNLGIKVDRNALWRLSLSYVPKQDQVGYIRGQITWQNPFGQPEKTAFVAGFAKTFEDTVRALSSLLRVHMKKSYWAFKDNGQWFIEEPADVKAFWKIKPGMILSDTDGQKFSMIKSAQHEAWLRWRLQSGTVQPCANVRQRSRCMVTTQSLKDAPPMLGWKQRRLRIQGGLPSNAEIFVAGFLATPLGDGQWEYWGHPGSNHKALIMSQGRILHSEVFVDNPATATVLRYAALALSKQAKK